MVCGLSMVVLGCWREAGLVAVRQAGREVVLVREASQVVKVVWFRVVRALAWEGRLAAALALLRGVVQSIRVVRVRDTGPDLPLANMQLMMMAAQQGMMPAAAGGASGMAVPIGLAGGSVPMGGYYRAGPRTIPVVKLRGLPFRCEEEDVLEFFQGLEILDILFVRKDGRFSGDGYVLFGNMLHAELALQVRGRYMARAEVSGSARVCNRSVTLLLLPRVSFVVISISKAEAESGAYEAHADCHSLLSLNGCHPSCSRAAWCASFSARQRNKMHMGRRYVEVFRCKKADYYNAIAREVEQDGGAYREGTRGLPATNCSTCRAPCAIDRGSVATSLHSDTL